MNAVRTRAIEELRRMVLDALGDHDAEVWLFGSCARDEVMQHSDIDVAVLAHEELPSSLLTELSADIEDSSIPYNVDLVDLRHASLSLVEEVRREGLKWKG
jgi:uncharacterized protein